MPPCLHTTAAKAFALAAALAAAASLGAAEPGRLQSFRLGMEQGLANNSVYCVLQDSSGLMWFGTFGGLSRYDGESFVTWRPRQPAPGSGPSLPASVVFALLEDGAGALWIGTDGGGLARLDPATGAFTLFRAAPGEPGSLGSDRVLALAEDSAGRIWAGCGDGSLQRLDPATGRFLRFARPGGRTDPVRCLLADGGGRIWAGTEGGGLLRLDPSAESLVALRHSDGDGRSLGSDVVRALIEDSAGRIWAGLGNGGVDLLDGEGIRHAWTARGSAVAPAEAVRALGEDTEGTIWVGFADSGLGSVEPRSLELRPPAPGSGAMVRAICRDRRGLMWVGLKEGGARAFNLRSALFERWTRRPDGSRLRDLRGLARAPGGEILAGSDGGGIVVVDPATGRVTDFTGLPADRAASKVYTLLSARDGTLWVGTDGGGLLAFGPGGTRRRWRHAAADPASLAGDVVWSLFEDRDGTVWVGTEGGGLDRWDPASGGFVHHRPDPDAPSLRGSSVRAVFRDSAGRLWAGTWDGGLSRMERGESRFHPFGIEPDDPAPLGDTSVNCVTEDSEGAIWVGTGGSGAARLDPATGRFVHYGEAEGLAGATVYGIMEDRGGDLWFTTSAGLSRFSRRSGAFFNFGIEDGLASGELSQNSFLLGPGGEIWVGGPAGLSRLDPSRLPATSIPPPVAITAVELPGAMGAAAKLRGPASARELELGFRNSGLSFHVAVLDYAAPDRNRYAMRLEGRGEGWINLGPHNAGTIAPLAPGRYVLRVKGSNGNGVWNEEGATLAITVQPPLWATWWFRLSAAAALAALLAGGIAARLGALRRRNGLLVRFSRYVEEAREEERIAAARDVHDEIGQHLAALNLQAYWLSTHQDAESGDRKERLAEMLLSISDAMGSVKSVATNLRPVALDALAFDEALRWYLRSFERRSGLRASLEIGDDLPRVEGALATALFRILQEMLTNVIRHAGASSVAARLVREGGDLLLEVTDDGRGIEPGRAGAEDSFGIIGMRERCAAFGGRLAVEATAGRGTRIAARVPAPARAAPRKES